MATVWIPPLVQTLTGGEQVVEAPGRSVREVFDHLEARYPGLTARLFKDGRPHPGIAMAVDGLVQNQGAVLRIDEDSEIHFVPAISGG